MVKHNNNKNSSDGTGEMIVVPIVIGFGLLYIGLTVYLYLDLINESINTRWDTISTVVNHDLIPFTVTSEMVALLVIITVVSLITITTVINKYYSMHIE